VKSSWRTQARPIVATVLAATRGQNEQAIRKALREAYPFGSRHHHPYRIWCDEIRIQRGLKHARTRELQVVDPNQSAFNFDQ
jgi:hypothetical protein